jgi:DNA polymerase-3 subunit epsilon
VSALQPALSAQPTIVAIVDTESTGLGRQDQAIAIGLIVCQVDSRGALLGEVGRYYGTQEPTCPIHPIAQRVHGLSMDLLRGTRFDRVTIGKLLAVADVLIAHNASFDARMLKPIIELSTRKWRCSYRQFPWKLAGRRRLDDVCSGLSVQRPLPHNALSDCQALLHCLLVRTGKTERSRTHLGALLAKAHVELRDDVQDRSERRLESTRPTAAASGARVVIVAFLIVLFAIAWALFH